MAKKNDGEAKSSRKPLNEITNGGGGGGGGRNSLKRSKIKKQASPEEDEQHHQHQQQQQNEEDNVLDRLLLVHSDLSNLIGQIDELVVNAVKVEGTSKKGKKEIDLFTNLLSDMHSSLKQWIPRFRNLLISPTTELRNMLEQPSPSKSPAVNEKTKNTDDSPVLSDMESFVSPSPLVSWCPQRTVESGRQLFLLTPLTRSRQLSSKSVSKRKMDCPLNTNIEIPSSLTICQDKDTDLPEGKDNKDMKSIPNKFSKSSVTEMASSLSRDFVSPPKLPNRSRSMFLMTPRLKMSPPKSCVLLEPIVELHQQENNNIRKKTPFPVRTKTHTATPFNIHFSESLTLKYPEMFGAQQSSHKSSMSRKEVDAPVDSLISSFESCVVKEPSDKMISMNMATDGNASSKPCILDEQAMSMTAAANNVQGENKSTKHSRVGSTSITCPESTPMWKEPESRNGKHPGENTLKKELWAKFEAASSPSNVLRLDVSIFQDMSRKGFLDRLEEVCCEELSSEPEGFR